MDTTDHDSVWCSDGLAYSHRQSGQYYIGLDTAEAVRELTEGLTIFFNSDWGSRLIKQKHKTQFGNGNGGRITTWMIKYPHNKKNAHIVADEK